MSLSEASLALLYLFQFAIWIVLVRDIIRCHRSAQDLLSRLDALAARMESEPPDAVARRVRALIAKDLETSLRSTGTEKGIVAALLRP